jgi:phage tail tape-measure protein
MWQWTGWKFLLTLTGVAGGIYLYAKRGPRRHRPALGIASGLLLGQHAGAATGLVTAGPVGLVVGSVVGGVVGAVAVNEWLDSVESNETKRETIKEKTPTT